MTPSGSREDRPAECPLRAVEVAHEGCQWVTMSHPDAELERQLWGPNPTNSPTVARTAGIGASRPFPSVVAKVALPNRQRAFSRRSGN
jgi:hypothetical protein